MSAIPSARHTPTSGRPNPALHLTAVEAVKTLVGLMDMKQPSNVRLGASKAVVDLAMKVRDAEEIQERLQALEERLAQDEKPKVGWRPSRN